VWDQPTSQGAVYDAFGAPALSDCIGGEEQDVTVLAYGVTGSGKTHTIFGSATDPGLAFHMLTALYASQRGDEGVIPANAVVGVGITMVEV
ncbi:hypothetical protein KIPB_015073, partial [Kipferlia bialata]